MAAAAGDDKWYFANEELQNTPSRQCGLDADKEMSLRQQAANFIQDMGQKLKVTQLCINTAIVYMHRFYVFHSFTHFLWNSIAAAALFLAAKVEEQPRKLEHVIRAANMYLHGDQVTVDIKSEQYIAQVEDLVFNENVLLQTLGFDVAIDHPHTYVVRCCHLVRASKDLAQASYFMASNSLHLTTMCLKYKPTVVACFCIHLACKWSNWEIPKSSEGKSWYFYVDKSVTAELLEQLTQEFLEIFSKCSSKLKKKILSITQNQHGAGPSKNSHSSSNYSGFEMEMRKVQESKDASHGRQHYEAKPGQPPPEDPYKKVPRPQDPSLQQRMDSREYREKKERERLEREKSHHPKPHQSSSSSSSVPNKHHPGVAPGMPKPPHHHRNPPPGVDPKMKVPRPPNNRDANAPHRDVKEHPANAPWLDAPANKEHGSSRDLMMKDGVGGRDLHKDYASRNSVSKDARELISYEDISKDVKPDLKEIKQEPRDVRDNFVNRDMPKHSYVKQEHHSKTVIKKEDITNDAGDVARLDDKNVVDKRFERPKTVDVKHDMLRHRRDLDPKYQKRPETVTNASVSDFKKMANSSNVQEKLVAMKPNSSVTSQRHHSPYADVKSVPTNPPVVQVKQETHNGNHGGPGYPAKEATPPPMPTKRPSLFSPEKTPPKKVRNKTPPVSGKRLMDTAPQVPIMNSVPPPVSPFGSPPPRQVTNLNRRSRTSSSGSEPELRPVLKKLDEISGFENIIRDSKLGIKLPKVPDMVQPINDRKPDLPSMSKETVPPDVKPLYANTTSGSQPIVNGIETNPTLISNLLKEVTPISTLPVVEAAKATIPEEEALKPTASAETESLPVMGAEVVAETKHKSEHRKSEKKKKKEKHKHKDRDKSKEEKAEKKKKHRDKEKHKAKTEFAVPQEEDGERKPIRVTIKAPPQGEPAAAAEAPRSPPQQQQPPPQTGGIKIKIPKDRLKTEPVPENSGSLKIKISKDAISGFSSSDNRKRTASPALAVSVPPAKVSKPYRNADARQNGRSSYTKVAQVGEGEPSLFKLAESKYHSKGAPKTS